MKLAILGTNGFIGGALLNYFKHNADMVLCLSGKKAGDLTNKSDPIFQKISNYEIDTLIHAAANTSGSNVILSNPSEHVYPNFIMNNHVFDAATRNPHIKHIIWFSCTVMYSDYPIVHHEDETIILDQESPYYGVANMKVATENLCRFYSQVTDKKFTIIRHSNVFGPGDKYTDHGHICATLIKKIVNAKDGDRITLNGTGRAIRDLLYIDDLCDFVLKSTQAFDELEKYEIYNVGSEEPCTIAILADKIKKLANKDVEIYFDETKRSIETVTMINCDKAHQHFEWWALSNRLKDAIESYQKYGR